MAMWVMAVVGGGAVPMFFTRRKPDHVARADFFHWDRLHRCTHPQPGRNDQCLTERMGMPCGAGAWLERDAGAKNARRCRRIEQRIDADYAGEIIRRSFA